MLQLWRNVWAMAQDGGEEMSGVAARMCWAVMCVGMTGCVGLPMMQTAETLEQGEVRLVAGGTLGIVAADEPIDEELSQLCLIDDTKCMRRDVWLIPAVSGRVGLAQGLDVGVAYEVGGMLRADLKPRLYTDDALTVGLSLGGGYSPLPSFVGAGWTERPWELSPALLWDYRANQALVLYATTRYTQRRVALLRSEDGVAVASAPSWQRSVAGSLGLKWGESFGVMGELGYAAWWGAPDAAQLGVGIFVDL